MEGEDEACTRELQALKMAEEEGEALCCFHSSCWASVAVAVGEEWELEGTGCWMEEVGVVCSMEADEVVCSCSALGYVPGSLG